MQDNHSRSVKDTVRGLHLQTSRPQAKLIRVLVGEIFDVAVDVRVGSPTFGKWAGVKLSADSFRQYYIPRRICTRLQRAHGHRRDRVQVHGILRSGGRARARVERPRAEHHVGSQHAAPVREGQQQSHIDEARALLPRYRPTEA